MYRDVWESMGGVAWGGCVGLGGVGGVGGWQGYPRSVMTSGTSIDGYIYICLCVCMYTYIFFFFYFFLNGIVFF